MIRNVDKTTFILFTRKTNGINFGSILDCTHIVCYQCVKDIGSL